MPSEKRASQRAEKLMMEHSAVVGYSILGVENQISMASDVYGCRPDRALCIGASAKLPRWFPPSSQPACRKVSGEDVSMGTFDYAEAELFPRRSARSRVRAAGYKRFAHAADAIKFAIEELPPEALSGACPEIDEARFDARGICRLYGRADYPLPRCEAKHKIARSPESAPAGGRPASWTKA